MGLKESPQQLLQHQNLMKVSAGQQPWGLPQRQLWRNAAHDVKDHAGHWDCGQLSGNYNLSVTHTLGSDFALQLFQ